MLGGKKYDVKTGSHLIFDSKVSTDSEPIRLVDSKGIREMFQNVDLTVPRWFNQKWLAPVDRA